MVLVASGGLATQSTAGMQPARRVQASSTSNARLMQQLQHLRSVEARITSGTGATTSQSSRDSSKAPARRVQPYWRETPPAVLVQGRETELHMLHQQFGQLAIQRSSRFKETSRDEHSHAGAVVAAKSTDRARALQLEKHILAVATEAGLPSNAAASLVAAALKGKISQNPGVLLLQMVGLLSLEDCLGRRQITSLICAMPVLLNHAPETLRWNFEVLCSVLGDTALPAGIVGGPAATRQGRVGVSSRPADVPKMISRVPALLIASPHTLWSNLDALSILLKTDFASARSMALRQPRLLANSPGALRNRFEALQAMTGLGTEGLSALLLRQPGLLTYFPETLAGNLTALSHALGVTLERVAPLLVRQPAVLMLAPATVTDKLTALSTLLSVPPKALAFLVLKQPSLLTLSSSHLEDKVSELGTLLRLSFIEAAALCVSSPNLLTLSIGGLRVKLTLLTSLAALSPSWQDQMKSAGTRSLAHWLCFSADRIRRLETAVAAGVAESFRLPAILAMKEVEFARQMAALQTSTTQQQSQLQLVQPPVSQCKLRSGLEHTTVGMEAILLAEQQQQQQDLARKKEQGKRYKPLKTRKSSLLQISMQMVAAAARLQDDT